MSNWFYCKLQEQKITNNEENTPKNRERIPTFFLYNIHTDLGRRKFLSTALLLSIGFVNGNHLAAQPNPRLSPEQQETVRLLLEGFGDTSRGPQIFPINCLSIRHNLPVPEAMAKEVKDIDSILVGKNIVFAPSWLDIIGNDRSKQVTQQQFEKWKESLDKLFETYASFIGRKPSRSDVILINQSTNTWCGHAHAGSFCMNPNNLDVHNSLGEIRRGTPGYVAAHEMAHVFSLPIEPTPWVANLETAAEFLTSYAMERGGLEFGFPKETRYRQNLLNIAVDNFQKGNIKSFTGEHGSAYNLYMLGLVDVVGWDTFKNTIQSYHNGKYMPIKAYDLGTGLRSHLGDSASETKNIKHAQTHEFFDRLAYFHDDARERAKTDSKILQTIPVRGRNLTGEQALRSLPDKGKLLDQHFTVKTTPIQELTLETVQKIGHRWRRKISAHLNGELALQLAQQNNNVRQVLAVEGRTPDTRLSTSTVNTQRQSTEELMSKLSPEGQERIKQRTAVRQGSVHDLTLRTWINQEIEQEQLRNSP